jgi:hypothetical protein
MKYKKIHDSLISRSKSQNRSKSSGIYERHHIVMTAVGGPDTDENTVLLTPREHYIVHALLWKMNPNNKQFRDPIFTFKNKGANNSRVYEAARIEHVKYMKEHNPSLYLSEESKASKSKKLKAYAKNRTAEHNAKIGQANSGKQTRLGAILSNDSKAKISESLKTYFKENPASDESREQARKRAIALNFKHTEEQLLKLKHAALNRKRYECPYCDRKAMDGGNFKLHMRSKHEWDNEKIEQYKTS